MKLSAPHKIVFLVSLIVAILAVVSHYHKIDYISAYQFWVLAVSYAILAVACLFRGV